MAVTREDRVAELSTEILTAIAMESATDPDVAVIAMVDAAVRLIKFTRGCDNREGCKIRRLGARQA